MTAVHDEHPVFAELQPVDEHDLAEQIVQAVAEGWHPTYDHDSEGAIGE